MAGAYQERPDHIKSIKRRKKGNAGQKKEEILSKNWKCKFIKGMAGSQKCGFAPFHPPRALEERSDREKFRNIQPASYHLIFLLCQSNGYYASIWKC